MLTALISGTKATTKLTRSTWFNTSNQRLPNQAKMDLMKSWFSDIKILKILEQVNREEYPLSIQKR